MTMSSSSLVLEISTTALTNIGDFFPSYNVNVKICTNQRKTEHRTDLY